MCIHVWKNGMCNSTSPKNIIYVCGIRLNSFFHIFPLLTYFCHVEVGPNKEFQSAKEGMQDSLISTTLHYFPQQNRLGIPYIAIED